MSPMGLRSGICTSGRRPQASPPRRAKVLFALPFAQVEREAGGEDAAEAAKGDGDPARRALRIGAHGGGDDGASESEGEGQLAAGPSDRRFEALGAAEVDLEVAAGACADEALDGLDH